MCTWCAERWNRPEERAAAERRFKETIRTATHAKPRPIFVVIKPPPAAD